MFSVVEGLICHISNHVLDVLNVRRAQDGLIILLIV